MQSDDRKYQVFVSSTYEDLREERQEVMHALLELDCIPSGMELFPAADESQWSLIKGVIDDCDYYIVILGGRYGSIGPEGFSYTEMEYRYAVEIGKPVAAFLHSDRGAIPAGKSESSDEGKAKLLAFTALVRQKMCKNWSNPHELGSVVSRSLVNLRKKWPGIGWVRGDKVPTSAAAEMLKLRKRIEELEIDLNRSRIEPPKGAAGLSQLDEIFEIEVKWETQKWEGEEEGYKGFTWNDSILFTWNELFSSISPLLLHEATTQQIHARLSQQVIRAVSSKFEEGVDGTPVDEDYAGHELNAREIVISRADLETIVVQFNALGYITQSVKTRSVSSRGDYWTLTPYGVNIMNQLRAVPARGMRPIASDSSIEVAGAAVQLEGGVL